MKYAFSLRCNKCAMREINSEIKIWNMYTLHKCTYWKILFKSARLTTAWNTREKETGTHGELNLQWQNNFTPQPSACLRVRDVLVIIRTGEHAVTQAKPSSKAWKRWVEGRLGGSVSWASNFSSGHDLTVPEFEPCIGLCAVSAEPALDPLTPSLSAPHPFACSLSPSLKNK